MELTKSRMLFYLLNKQNCLRNKKEPRFLKGVTVTNRTTVKQIMYMVGKLPEQSYLILILHSVLPRTHQGYGKDKWYMDEDVFVELCKNLKADKNIQVITTQQLVEGNV